MLTAVAAVLSLVSPAYSQSPSEANSETGQTFNNSLSIGKSGGTGLLVYRKYDNSLETAIRYSAGGYYRSSNSNYDSYYSSAGFKYKSRNNWYNANFGIGKQKGFQLGKNISAYAGLDVVLGVSGDRWSQNLEMVDSLMHSETNFSNSSSSDWSNGDYSFRLRRDGANLSLTARPVLGIDFKINDRISVGVEHRINALTSTYSFGEKLVDEYDYESQEYSETINADSYMSFNANLIGSTFINLTVFL